MPSKKKRDAKKPGFDDILGELSEVVEGLEEGELPLEEALERFERGVKLAREGERILGQAEKRVEVLLAGPEGDEVAPLDDGDAEEPRGG